MEGNFMKTGIKNLAAAIALALIIISGAAAQPESAERKGMKPELVMKNFESSLQWNDFPDIVESTVYNIVIYKNRFPGLDYSDLAESLQRVAEESKDLAISYKAQLAYIYLNNSSKIDLTIEQTLPSHEYVFKQISEQLEQKLLASHAI
jgi:hypothetical protein